MKKLCLATVLGTMVLTGCLGKGEEVKSVDYYKQNLDEMQAKIKECQSNPGEFGLEPNCVNASKARLGSGKSIPQNW